MRLLTIMFDSADPDGLAEFYLAATGWRKSGAHGDFVFINDGGPVQLGFQRVADYQGPTWPEDPKHAHLDFGVPDVDAAVATLLELGARKPDSQPGGDRWTVLIDPEGHPFCLTAVD